MSTTHTTRRQEEESEDSDAYLEGDNTGSGSDTEVESPKTYPQRYVEVVRGDPRYLLSPWRCSECDQFDRPCTIDHAQGKCIRCLSCWSWCNMSPVPKYGKSHLDIYPQVWPAIRLWYNSVKALLLRDPHAEVPPPSWAHDDSLLPQKAATLDFDTRSVVGPEQIRCTQELEDKFVDWAASNPDRFSRKQPRLVTATTNFTPSKDTNGKRKVNPCSADGSPTMKRLRSNGDPLVSQGLALLSRVVPPTPTPSSSTSASASLPLPRKSPSKQYVGAWPPGTSTTASSSSAPPPRPITLPISPPLSTATESTLSTTRDPASELTKSVMASLALFQTQATERLESSLSAEKTKNAILTAEIHALRSNDENGRAELEKARSEVERSQKSERALREEVQWMKDELKKKNEDIKCVHKVIQRAKEELAKVREEVEKGQEEAALSQERQRVLREEMANMREELVTARGEVEKGKKRERDLQESLKDLQAATKEEVKIVMERLQSFVYDLCGNEHDHEVGVENGVEDGVEDEGVDEAR